MKKVTYYLIAENTNTLDMFDDIGAEGLVDSNETFNTFEFIEGETPSVEFAMALEGKYYYIISESEYNQLDE